jgi:hypothetical protein
MTGAMHRAFSETRLLAEKAQAEAAETPTTRRSLRGPERFFYDRSTYTGAHAFKAGPRDEEAQDAPVEMPEPEKLSVASLQCPMCEHKFRSRKAHPKCPTCLSSVPRDEEQVKAQLVTAGRAAVDPWRKLAVMRRSPSSEASTRAPSAEPMSRAQSKERIVEQVRTLGWWERGGERDSVLRAQAVTESEKTYARKPTVKPPLPSMPKLRPL